MIKKSPKAQYTYILIFYYCHVFFRVVNKKKTFDPVDLAWLNQVPPMFQKS